MERIKEEETLYEEALESIRQLNEEVFLRDLREMMKKEVGYITEEIEYSSKNSKEMLSRLSSESCDMRDQIKASRDATERIIERLELRVDATFSQGDQNLLNALLKMEGLVSRTTESYKAHTANQLRHHIWLSEQWRRQGQIWGEEQDGRLAALDDIQKDNRTNREAWEESSRMFLQSMDDQMKSLSSVGASYKAGIKDMAEATESILSMTDEFIPEMKHHHDTIVTTLQADGEKRLQAQRAHLDSWKEDFEKQAGRIEDMLTALTSAHDERVLEQEEESDSQEATILDKQSQIKDAVVEYLDAEKERLRTEQLATRKEIRWWFGGGVLLISTIQVVLHFV